MKFEDQTLPDAGHPWLAGWCELMDAAGYQPSCETPTPADFPVEPAP